MALRQQRQVAVWLLICCALVFAMVVLGGVTRLTGSGLSMVRWEPLSGIVPPLSEAQWHEEFAHYQLSPEYQKVNVGMDLEGFQGIFWLEYWHRVLGRAIGLVFLLPFLYFLARRAIDRPLVPRMLVIFVLGGLQGLLGWYMVKSGLVDNPHVSQYRLTAHLAAAVIIYGYMLWVALGLLTPQPPSAARGRASAIGAFGFATVGLIFLTLLSGGFVAGTRAGYVYNTFPLMAGRWIPEGLLELSPAYLNLFENITTIQFDHRVLAVLVLVAVVTLWFRAMRAAPPRLTRISVHLLLALCVAQFGLGVGTLLSRVPVSLAATHQASALLLFTVALVVAHQLRRAPLDSTTRHVHSRPT